MHTLSHGDDHRLGLCPCFSHVLAPEPAGSTASISMQHGRRTNIEGSFHATLEATPVHDDGNSHCHSVVAIALECWWNRGLDSSPRKEKILRPGDANNRHTPTPTPTQPSPKPPPSPSVSESSPNAQTRPFRPMSQAWTREKKRVACLRRSILVGVASKLLRSRTPPPVRRRRRPTPPFSENAIHSPECEWDTI